MGAFWITKDANFLQTDNEDIYQTGRTCQKVQFLMLLFLPGETTSITSFTAHQATSEKGYTLPKGANCFL